ncbi:MAG TPA: NAD(P)H-dependent glycerol-3-phosphate dehydrogenase [Candidatus Methylomirabilis sp.]|nr:NAD(P)H-dependent glycerol-3-phosphate dehydrogenase [Candidatus Methylomirabilis sp.]
MKRIAILGGGSWGTALAIVLSNAHQRHGISLWVRDPALAESLRRTRENTTYLPGHKLPELVQVTTDAESALQNVGVIVGALPAAHARDIYQRIVPHLARGTAIVSATKGLEPETHLRMSEVISQVIPADCRPRVAVLSGPSFAAEAASGHPTAVVLASSDLALANELQEQFAGASFRLYTNDDVLGVELAGAMKNVIAIAAGACQGIGLGSNSLAALITRGLAEMTRLAVALGARAETLSGLAGLGDLVLTCTGSLSRNRHVGIELGKGRRLADILAGMKMVAEGVGTAGALLALARDAGVELPITEQVSAILHEGKSPRSAIRSIMDRPLKRE